MNVATGGIYLIGFAFSLLVGRWATQRVLATIPTETAHYSAELLGLVEATIYTTAWLLGREVFIPVWLGLKVSGNWRAPLRQVRPIFNRWLIGTGMSLAYGIVGAEFIKHAKPGEWWMAVGLPILLVVGTLLLAWWGRVLERGAAEGR